VRALPDAATPNTSFEVVKALIEFFCQDNEMVDLIMVYLRVALLEEEWKKQTFATIKDLQIFSGCLLSVGK
jgi:hypothetical protein